MVDQQYVFKITEVVKVTDGDTYWLRVDVGFRGELLINVRLMGYDCPEARRGSDYEKERAIDARQVVADWFGSMPANTVWIRTEKDPDNFGRWLGEVWAEVGTTSFNLGGSLRSRELASVWPTRWRDEFDKATP